MSLSVLPKLRWSLLHTFSRLDTAFAVQLAIPQVQGLICVVKEAQTSWQTFEVLEAHFHFGDASLKKRLPLSNPRPSV